MRTIREIRKILFDFDEQDEKCAEVHYTTHGVLVIKINPKKEAEEIAPEDLEAAADYFDKLSREENDYKTEHQNDYYER